MDQPTATPPAHRLEELIQEHKPVVKRLAEAADVDYSTVHRWRQGGSISSDKLIAVAEFFGVTVDYLLGRGEGIDS